MKGQEEQSIKALKSSLWQRRNHSLLKRRRAVYSKLRLTIGNTEAITVNRECKEKTKEKKRP